MKKAKLWILLGVWVGLSVVKMGFDGKVWAESCDLECLGKQISELEKSRQMSEDATKPLEVEVIKLRASVGSIGAQLDSAEVKLREVALSIDDRERAVAAKYVALSERVREFYKRSRTVSPLMVLLSSRNAGLATREISYQAAVAGEDRQVITKTTQEILQLEVDARKLEQDKVELASLRARLDAQAKFYEVEIGKAREYQKELSAQIAELSAKQQAILSEKSGTFQTTVGDVPLADDAASRPDYNPGFSPAFAAFSFGAPHFKGMSQYGALGRAKSGQSYEAILRAYYGSGIEIREVDTNTQITVEGYGTFSLEEYAKRIYEMPGSWGDEGGMAALEAQAIAARSYALARGGSICATESCQVFKPGPKGGNWETAVNNTSGKVVFANGQPLSTWYASTSGGYQESYSSQGHTTPGFWDTKNGRAGWTGEAYEKIANSPWFYKGWYKSRSGDSCGRSHPWLTGEEMADVLNAWVVLIKNGQSDDRVTPLGPCWGGSPYSIEEMRSRAAGLGGGYSKVTGVNVSYRDDGVTAKVAFETDKGSLSIDGLEFKKAFNLRAPGRVALKSGLFNIEKK